MQEGGVFARPSPPLFLSPDFFIFYFFISKHR
jgi:hypothetical protein